MEWKIFLTWVFSTLGSAGVVSVVVYFFKDFILKYYEKKIISKFDRDLEQIKSEIRGKETQLNLIANYLTELQKNRTKVKHEKQLIAAEDCLKIMKVLNKTSLMISMLQTINFKKVYLEERELQLKGFAEKLFHDTKIENILSEVEDLNTIFVDLYLDDESLNNFEIFKGITYSAIVLVIAFKDKTTKFLKKEDKEIVNKILENLPETKKSFEKYGDEYIFVWHSFFYRKALTSLRHCINVEKNIEDITHIQNITMNSKKIYDSIHQQDYELPEDLKI